MKVSHFLCHPYRDPPVKVSVTIKELRGLMFYDHWATWLCKRASSIRIHSNSKVWLKQWNCAIMMSLWSNFPIDQIVLVIVWHRFTTNFKPSAYWNIPSPPVTKGCKIGTLKSISSPVAVKYGAVCVCPYITVWHVCAYVSVCNRVQQRATGHFCS